MNIRMCDYKEKESDSALTTYMYVYVCTDIGESTNLVVITAVST